MRGRRSARSRGRGSPPRPGATMNSSGWRQKNWSRRVLPGDVDGQAAAPAPGPPPHLPQAGDGAGEGDADRRVELADVDPELERVGRDDREQLAGGQPRLDLAPLLRRVAAAVGSDPVGQVAACRADAAPRRRSAGSARSRGGCRGSRSSARPGETRSASSSAASESAERRAPVALSISGGFHIAIPRPARGAPSLSTSWKGVADQPLGELLGVGDRRRGEDEARLGAVERAIRRSRRSTLATWEPKTPR